MKYSQKQFHPFMVLSLVLLLSGCTIIPGVSLKQQGSAAPTIPVQPIVVPHRPYLTAEAWFDITSSDYPSLFFTQAVQKVADSIDQAVQPNEDGATFTISLINHNSFSSASTVIVITLPALPADPAEPKLLPPPPATGDPYQDTQNQQHTQETNARLLAGWQHTLRTNHTLLAQVRKAIRAQTDRLRRLAPPADTVATDLHGAFERAALRLQQAPPGEKYLLVESDLAETTQAQDIGSLHLAGVHVRIIFHPCVNASFCLANDTYWQQVLLQAGAADLHIFDPAQSTTIRNVFS